MTVGLPSGEATTPTLSVEHFAAVQAALQDGFDLEAILAVEGIDEPRWRTERARLTQTVAEDAGVYETYQRALEEAQDRLRCPVDPLYDDLEAWIGFLVLVDTTPLAELCAKHGLTAGDFGRLERHWRSRFAADPELAKKAKGLRTQAPPPAAPTALTVGERRLVPSPHAAGGGAAASPAPTTGDASPQPGAEDAPDPELVDRMAALEAYLGAGIDLGLLEGRFGFTGREQANARLEAFRASLDRQTAIYYRQRLGHFEALAAAGGRPSSPVAPTSPVTPSSPMTPRSPVAYVSGPSPEESLDETAALDPSLLSLAPLPFLDGPVALAPAVSPADDEPHHQKGETGILDPAMFASLATPFDTPNDQLLGSSVDETAAIDMDALAKALAAMPFEGSASAPPSAVDEIDPATSLDETAALDPQLFAEAAMPFSRPDVAPTAGHPLHDDLNRYASYCVELVELEGREAEVRARYGVASAEQHEAIAQAWTARLGRDAAQRKRFQEAIKTYREWLRSNRGKR